MSDIIDDYFKLQQKIYDHFGYVEDWVVIPIDDRRAYYWCMDDTEVTYAETIEKLMDEDAADYYSDEVYHQRFLPRSVYEAEDMTMIVVDTHTDGNKFLAIYDNAKRKSD